MTVSGVEVAASPPAVSRSQQMRRHGRKRHEGWFRSERVQRRATGAILLAFPLLYGLLDQHLGQDMDWDVRNYHLVDPYWVLVNHMRDVLPASYETFISPFLNMPFYFGVLHLSARWVDFLLALFQAASFPLLYLAGRSLFKGRAISLAVAALGMFAAGAWSEIGTAMGDNMVAPFLLAGLVLMLQSSSRLEGSTAPDRRALRMLIVAGIFIGLGVGLKFAEFTIAAGLLLALFFVAVRVRQRVRLFVCASLGCTIGLLVSYGWWAYELTAHFDSPVFPYFNNVLQSKFAPAGPTLGTHPPAGLLQAIFFPFAWTFDPVRTSQVNFRELSMPIDEALLILLLLRGAIGMYRSRTWRWPPAFGTNGERLLVAGFVISYAAWVHEYATYRYFIPAEMMSFLVMAVCVRSLLGAFTLQSVSSLVLAGLLVFCVVTEVPGNWGRVPWARNYFTVDVPEAFRAHASTLLMVGPIVPIGYAVPYFPKDTLVLGIYGGGLTPAMQRIIQDDIDHHHQHLYLWWADPTGYASQAAFLAGGAHMWEQYHVQLVPGSCQQFDTYMGAAIEAMNYCSAVYVAPTAGA